jgi:alpha-tubulin suppressor-like RCC1 family protein
LDPNNTNYLFGHTCAVTPEGDAWCWGTNIAGELGGPSFDECLPFPELYSCSASPIPVQGGIAFSFVAVGNMGRTSYKPHTCGLSADGGVYCWGANVAGQLGNGTYEDSMMPVRVAFGLGPASAAPAVLMTSQTTTDTDTDEATVRAESEGGE